ncbi:TetR family transcriptional regulator C-terminal domain-containing protein [Brachybacterium hainanense]|uniref:TetR family transcriptional regulator C-terminal domain-containing protein n=1 Tax=Brachybacterium hainanense TaxID=1541174 RepID=A0ABV6RFL0_9MICO
MSRDAIQHSIVEIVAASGVGGLSVRAVAARAGVAIGTVQHHFPTRSAMIAAAMTIVEETAEAIEAGSGRSDPVERLTGLTDLLIPSSVESTAGRVWLAFAAQAAVDEAVAAQYRRTWSRLQRSLAELLARARPELAWSRADAAATELLALLDGLSVAVLVEPGRISVGTAREIAQRRLAELLT